MLRFLAFMRCEIPQGAQPLKRLSIDRLRNARDEVMVGGQEFFEGLDNAISSFEGDIVKSCVFGAGASSLK